MGEDNPRSWRCRSRSRKDRVLAVVCIGSLIFAQGCSTKPPPQPPPSEALRASLGTVGVVSVVPAPEGRLNPTGPGVGGGAAGGAARGALEGLSQAAHSATGAAGGGGALGALVALVILTPVYVVVGGVAGGAVGAAAIIPESAAKEIETTLRQVVAEHEPQAELRRLVMARAAAETTEKTIDLGTGGIIDPGVMPDYALLAAKGVQTVLEVGVLAISLTGKGGSDPVLVLSVDARARLIHAADNLVLWSDEHVRFATPSHKYSEWSAEEAALLKSDLERGLEVLARQINDKVFLEFWSGQESKT